MAKRKNGCLDWEGMISNGENPNGIVTRTPCATNVGTEPRDMLGRQDYAWGKNLNGDRFTPYGQDGGEMGGEGGPFADMPRASKKRK